jgi:sec-independent protein translocase protein TatC
MKKAPLSEHLKELKHRCTYVLIMFIAAFAIGYSLSDKILELLLRPLIKLGGNTNIIYTNLTEPFFSYMKLSSYFASFCTLPFLLIQLYLFIVPGLHKREKTWIAPCLFLTPILFCIGAWIAYYWIFPVAWKFFISFENHNIPIKLEARVSEYLSLSSDIIIAFGLAFQLPILLLLLNRFGLVSVNSLKQGRRFSIVVIFIIAAIITPPDVLSQVILASIMILLYEGTILACTLLFKDRRML